MQYFSLNTNVKQLRIGRGVSKGIGKELGKYVVATMEIPWNIIKNDMGKSCLLYTSPSPRDRTRSRMPSSA